MMALKEVVKLVAWKKLQPKPKHYKNKTYSFK